MSPRRPVSPCRLVSPCRPASLRRLAVFGGLALALSAGCAKTGQANSSASNDGIENSIKLTGVSELDSVFQEAAEIDTILDDCRRSLKTGRVNLAKALELPEGTPLEDSLTELKQRAKGKLKVAQKNGKVSITASDAVPGNVQEGLDALQDMLDGYAASLDALASLPDQVQSLSKESSALVKKLEDPSSLGLSATEIPGIAKKSNKNLKMISNMPNRVDKLTGELTRNTSLVVDTLRP